VSIELIPLCTATFTLKDPLVLPNTPSGIRSIVEVAAATLEGQRLSATLKGAAAADWATVGPDLTCTLDVRTTFETHDGALLFAQYRGRVDFSKPFGESPVYTAPLFETGDERYAWLNRIQAVAKGKLGGPTLTYEIYEVR
jgi:Protein of unknown function (DUF3237)